MDTATIEQTNVWLPLLTPVGIAITAVFAVLGTVALFYAHKAVAYFEKIAGVTLSDAQRKDIDDAVIKGIHYADEQAHKFAIKMIDSGPRTPDEKLAVAEQAARSIAPKALADMTSTQFQVHAEAALQSVRPLPELPLDLDQSDPITKPDSPKALR
jgi:hypothetical protein